MPALLLLPVLLVCLLPGPVLLGTWESLTYFHTFGAVEAPLTFLIAPRANIAGQGYALLEAARPLIPALGLEPGLAGFRVPAMVASLLTLLLFFVVARRAFGAWPALGAAALLAVNPLFFQVGHMMSVLVLSGAALLFLVERLQALEARYWSLGAWLGTGLALALVALHYGPARIFAAALLGLWLLRAAWRLRGPAGAPVRRGIVVLACAGMAAALVVLGLLDARNLLSVAQLPTFFFPRDSDIAVLQYAPGAAGVAGVATMLETNLRIVAESFAGWTGDYHARHPSYVLADFRMPLLTPAVAVLAAAGLLVALGRWRRRTPIFGAPWAEVMVMLAVFLVPVLFSLVLLKPEGPFATLSVHRLYFCLFPLHLLVAALLQRVGEVRIPAMARGAGMLVAALFVAQLLDLVAERNAFANLAFAPGWERAGPGIEKRWDDGAPNRDRREYDFYSHLQQHAQYANVAREMARRVEGRAPVPRIIYVDVNRFSEAPLTPAGLHYISGRNFHAVFLALYAREAGLRIDPVAMVDASRAPVRPDLMAGLAYRGRPREYSALLESGGDGRLRYVPGTALAPVVLPLAGMPAGDLLATTPEEEAGARELMRRQGTAYELVRL